MPLLKGAACDRTVAESATEADRLAHEEVTCPHSLVHSLWQGENRSRVSGGGAKSLRNSPGQIGRKVWVREQVHGRGPAGGLVVVFGRRMRAECRCSLPAADAKPTERFTEPERPCPSGSASARIGIDAPLRSVSASGMRLSRSLWTPTRTPYRRCRKRQQRGSRSSFSPPNSDRCRQECRHLGHRAPASQPKRCRCAGEKLGGGDRSRTGDGGFAAIAQFAVLLEILGFAGYYRIR